MKTFQSLMNSMVTFGLILSLASCGNSGREQHAETGQIDMHQENYEGDEMQHSEAMSGAKGGGRSMNMSDISKASVNEMLSGYFNIKNALVQTSSKEAAESAHDLLTVLEKDPKHMGVFIPEVQKIASAEDIEMQRNQFEHLSEKVYQQLKVTDASDAPVYRMFCPMAFDNKGAYWLSEEREVNNPYFGDKMLRCGTVKEEI